MRKRSWQLSMPQAWTYVSYERQFLAQLVLCALGVLGCKAAVVDGELRAHEVGAQLAHEVGARAAEVVLVFADEVVARALFTAFLCGKQELVAVLHVHVVHCKHNQT